MLAIDAAAPPSPVTTISAIESNAFARSREAIEYSPRGAPVDRRRRRAVSRGMGRQPCHAAAQGRRGALRRRAPGHRRAAPRCRAAAQLGASLRGSPSRHPAQAGRRETARRRHRRRTGLARPPARSASPTLAETLPRRPARGRTAHQADAGDSRRQCGAGAVLVASAERLAWAPTACAATAPISPATEHIVYATAELLSIEFENGILAMEFAAPRARRSHSADDAPPQRSVPGRGQAHRVRLGRAAHARAPQDPRQHTARQPRAHRNRHRSARHLGLLQRSPPPGDRAQEHGLHHVLFRRSRRALAPAPARWLHGDSDRRNRPTKSTTKSPSRPTPLHGDFANLALEADGVPLGRAHVQLFRPASIRLALRHAIPLRPANRNHSGAAHRRHRSQGRRQSRNLDPQQLLADPDLSPGAGRRGPGIPAAQNRHQHRPHRRAPRGVPRLPRRRHRRRARLDAQSRQRRRSRHADARWC